MVSVGQEFRSSSAVVLAPGLSAVMAEVGPGHSHLRAGLGLEDALASWFAASVCWGRSHQVPQTGWFKQHFYFPTVWRLGDRQLR